MRLREEGFHKNLSSHFLKGKRGAFMKRRKMRELPLHLMILPSVIMLICFSYLPMAGIVIAFQKFIPAKACLAIKNGLDLKISVICLSCRILPAYYGIRCLSLL